MQSQRYLTSIDKQSKGESTETPTMLDITRIRCWGLVRYGGKLLPDRSPNLNWNAMERTGQAKDPSCPSLEAAKHVSKSPFSRSSLENSPAESKLDSLSAIQLNANNIA